MTASWDAECVAWRCLGPCLQATESERDSGLQVLRGAETRGGRSPDATVQRERERESERERETESQTRGLLPPLAPSKAKSEASRGVGLRARGFRPSYPTKRQRERERAVKRPHPVILKGWAWLYKGRDGAARQSGGWGLPIPLAPEQSKERELAILAQVSAPLSWGLCTPLGTGEQARG